MYLALNYPYYLSISSITYHLMFLMFLNPISFPPCPHPPMTPSPTPQSQPFPVAQYGGRFTVTMIPGDGIGPEMMGYVRNIFRYAGVPVDFEEVQITKDSTEEEFEKALICIKRNGVALKGKRRRR